MSGRRKDHNTEKDGKFDVTGGTVKLPLQQLTVPSVYFAQTNQSNFFFSKAFTSTCDETHHIAWMIRLLNITWISFYCMEV